MGIKGFIVIIISDSNQCMVSMIYFGRGLKWKQ
jgi:hypothetical protein